MPTRFHELERQVAEIMRGNVSVAARADGAAVVTAEMTPVGRAIRIVLSELRKEVPYDSCSVQELRGSRLAIVGGVGFADLDVILGESFDIDNLDIPNGEVIYRRRPLIVGDAEQYRAFRRGLHVGADIHSWLGVPMIDGDHVAGMIALDKAEPDFYSAAQADVALSFAAIVARAFRDARSRDAQSYA
ncbi:MAG TPA: GAF domain-containing protein [Thermoanaerobaculia bacterium]|nr:GAF domain-containing protein [Thermoanaerobaculia bacterium]